jgi:hypothetical protein
MRVSRVWGVEVKAGYVPFWLSQRRS